jgi:hypothetical protein
VACFLQQNTQNTKKVLEGTEMNHNRIRKFFLFLLTIFFSFSITGETVFADTSPIIAVVEKVNGTATVVRQGRTISAKTGLDLYQYDTLRTGSDGSIGVIFNDDTSLSLGPESILVIDEFVFAPRQGKYSIALRMIKGTVAYFSGLISKLAPDSAHIETPTASIGIRGTKFVARVEGE